MSHEEQQTDGQLLTESRSIAYEALSEYVRDGMKVLSLAFIQELATESNYHAFVCKTKLGCAVSYALVKAIAQRAGVDVEDVIGEIPTDDVEARLFWARRVEDPDILLEHRDFIKRHFGFKDPHQEV